MEKELENNSLIVREKNEVMVINNDNINNNDTNNSNKDTKEDISYNLYLYQKRLELKLSRRKFAKLLKLRPLHYKLIENGYIKPLKRDIERISDYFNEDFNYYLEDFRGYPTELDNKKYMKITNYLYHLFNKTWLRITFLVIAIISIITLITSFAIFPKIDTTRADLYDETVNKFNKEIIEKGTASFSMYDFKYPLVSQNYNYDDGLEKAVIIKSKYDEKLLSLSFNEIIWTDDFRFNIRYININNDGTFTYLVTSFNYTNNETNTFYIYEKDHEYFLDNKIEDRAKAASEFIKGYYDNNDFRTDFNDLIKEKLDTDITFEDVVYSINDTKALNSKKIISIVIIIVISLLFTCLFSFLFGYSSIYKKERNERIQFSHSDELLDIKPRYEKTKKDIKFTPFIPETLLKTIGIILVAIGSLRMIFYTMNVNQYAVDNINNANQFLTIQMMGMFVIFFINFDVYMDDNRLFRNLMLYPMIFVLIYVLEASLMNSIMKENSIFSVSLSYAAFPNPFFSATCYYMIMLFLFFTPSYIKTKKRLIVFRSLAIIPIILIILFFILGNADILFNHQFESYWTKYLFRGDRFPISMLAVSYLVSLYFLRLYYKKKYGEKNAFRYFMGNRYILIKNAIAALLIIIIWAIELSLSGNTQLNKMGIGINTYLIILAPLVFFYHPHKNARNTKLDVTLIITYGLLLAILYLAAGIIALVSFVL